MKLYLNKTSPYARLVMVVAHEKNLAQQIECVWTDPWVTPAELLAVNPYSKVPVLVTADGLPITESTCICDYLDDIGNGRRLLPKQRTPRLPVLRKYGLGRGLIDTAFSVTIDRRFHPAQNEPALGKRWLAAVGRAITTLEQHHTASGSGEDIDLGDLAIAVGLSYTEFRLPEVAWQSSCPRLVAWLSQIAARQSMRLTVPD